MFKESIFFKVWLFFVNVFNQYESSAFYNLFIKASNSVKKIYFTSVFYNVFSKHSEVYKKYEASVFYNLKEKSLKKIVVFGKKACESYLGSKVKKSFIGKCCRLDNLITVFLMIMLMLPHSLWNNLYFVVGMVFILTVYFLKFANDNREIKFRQSVFLVIFLIATVMAVLITPSVTSGARIALFIFASVILMITISDGINSKEMLVKLIYGLITAFSVACLYGIYQGITHMPADVMFTDIANNKGMPGRITAMFENPNNFAELIVLLSPFSLAMFMSANKKSTKGLMFVLFCINIVALLMTYSRGSYISFAISIIVFVLLYDYRIILPLLVLCAFAVPFLPSSVLNRIMTIGSRQDTSTAFRIYLWEGVINLIKKEGISGVGLGPDAFQIAYTPFASRFAANAPHSHMLYLELFVEMGLLGGIGFFGFMISSLRKGFLAFSRTDKTLKCIIIASLSAFIGIAFSAATEYIWFYPRVLFVFWGVLGILLCAVGLSNEHK